ncbi:MAG: DUF503 domain-containing protein [Chloroflexi bacterium]|nr:DUF503 domain-containing protein [Chloroflexota bacterium]
MPPADGDGEMTTVSVLLTLHIAGAQSLKEKRAVVRSIVERLRARLHVSAAEVGLNDRPQAALVGFAVVSGDRATARRLADEARRFVDRELLGRAEVVATAIDEDVLERDRPGAGW